MGQNKYQKNQYIIFKYLDEWQEGKIIDYKIDNSKISYQIYSLKSLKIIPNYISDHIILSTLENIKKVSYQITNLDILKNNKIIELINYDKKMINNNKFYKDDQYTINKILDMLYKHLIDNKIYLTKDEIVLSIEGLKNIFLENNLKMCQKEKEMDDILNNFGVVQIVRGCFIILKYLIVKEESYEVKQSIYSICIYLLDFIICNYKIFYDRNNYM